MAWATANDGCEHRFGARFRTDDDFWLWSNGNRKSSRAVLARRNCVAGNGLRVWGHRHIDTARDGFTPFPQPANRCATILASARDAVGIAARRRRSGCPLLLAATHIEDHFTTHS